MFSRGLRRLRRKKKSVESALSARDYSNVFSRIARIAQKGKSVKSALSARGYASVFSRITRIAQKERKICGICAICERISESFYNPFTILTISFVKSVVLKFTSNPTFLPDIFR